MKNDYEIRGEVTAIFLYRKDGTVVETIISTSDLGKLELFEGKWHLSTNKWSKQGYARTHLCDKKTISLHRFLVDAGKELQIDHINHDTLDNRIVNLRIATVSENQINRSGANGNNKSSGVLGVNWYKHRSKWEAKYMVNGKRTLVGRFNTIAEAETALNKAKALL